MKKNHISNVLIFATVLLTFSCIPKSQEHTTLKDAFSDKFYIGTALNRFQIMGRDSAAMEVVTKHFSAIVAENCMKSGPIQPKEGEFNFELSDKFVEYGTKNNMFITGHCLIWHSQAPSWFFTDSLGNEVSPEVLTTRMRTHIYTVVRRYKGAIKGWDVVNEAIEDDGSFRKSKFYKILGDDFIKLAFQFAHEADPDCELYYNDYSMSKPGKREGVIKMVKKLQEQGVKIDGIGMQTHIGLDYPNIADFEASMEAFSSLGVKVLITEMDISALPSPNWNRSAEISTNIAYRDSLNPYTNGLPDSVRLVFNDRYLEFFKLFLKHQRYVSRVTVWGVNDALSWKNGFPVQGRTDYPLLFDRNNQPKSVVQVLIDEAIKE